MSTKLQLSDHELEVLAHSLGINLYHAKRSKLKRDKKLPKEFYRNHFAASEGHSDYPALLSLSEKGYMQRSSTINTAYADSMFFYVTEAGQQAFREAFTQAVNPTVAI